MSRHSFLCRDTAFYVATEFSQDKRALCRDKVFYVATELAMVERFYVATECCQGLSRLIILCLD